MGNNSELVALILAAGEGTRMKSDLAKVLHEVCGRSMIRYVVETVRAVSPSRIIVVVGYQAELVKSELGGEGLEFVIQSERLGTGHATQMSEPLLEGFEGTIVVLNGDVPLLSPGTLISLIRFHRREKASATVLSAILDNPSGYGRIVRDGNGKFVRIVEDGDATGIESEISEINSGIFCFESKDLFPSLARIDRRNIQGEYYITDVIEILEKEGKKVRAYICDQKEEVLGINDKDQLKAAERLMSEDG